MTKTKLTYRDALKKTGRTQYVNEDVAKTMPPPTEGPIEFFYIGKYVIRAELEQEYVSRGLVPASPVSLALYDATKAGRKRMDQMGYVGTTWEAGGDKCYAIFDGWGGERYVSVDRDVNDWHDHWWFAGVRKSASTSEPTSSSETLPLVLEINGVTYKRV